jgi:hypothetical protein
LIWEWFKVTLLWDGDDNLLKVNQIKIEDSMSELWDIETIMVIDTAILKILDLQQLNFHKSGFYKQKNWKILGFWSS